MSSYRSCFPSPGDADLILKSVAPGTARGVNCLIPTMLTVISHGLLSRIGALDCRGTMSNIQIYQWKLMYIFVLFQLFLFFVNFEKIVSVCPMSE